MKKTLLSILAVAVVAGGASFYGGMKYAQSKIPVAPGDFTNLSPAERQARFQQSGGGGARNNARTGGGFTGGEIISKDEKSVTVKLRDGGSKIIFFTQNTPVLKSVSGSPADLSIGEEVIITGTPNQDGSLNAQSIQIRPALPADNQ